MENQNYIERNRDFKGVWIPKDIWLNDQLTMLEKVILVEIDSLDNEQHCIAGNDYLAQFCQCSIPKVTQAVKKLTELGYIEVVSFDGRHRKLRSCIMKNMTQSHKKYDSDSGEVLAININNNIDTNINNNNDETSSSPENKSSSSKRKSRKDQLVEYVNSTSFAQETKDMLFKWIFQIGLKGNVTVDQLRDMLKNIWYECSGNELLVKESIQNSYLNNWFGFYPPKKSTNSSEKKSSNHLTLSNNKMPAQPVAQGDKPKLHPTLVF